MEWDPALYQKNSSEQYQIGLRAIEMLHPRPHEHILDVGCGTGELTACIAEKVRDGRVLGIDSDPKMINAAIFAASHRGLKSLSFRQMDATEITFQAAFDAVFSNIMLHWIENLDRMFQSLHHALKPGGRLLISTVFDEPPREGDPHPSMVTAAAVDLGLLLGFVAHGHHLEFLSQEAYLDYQAKMPKKPFYRAWGIGELETVIVHAGFSRVSISTRIFWQDFPNLDAYMDYRQSTIWTYLLAFFPRELRGRIVARMRELFCQKWEAIPVATRENPIREKWPIAFISATKT